MILFFAAHFSLFWILGAGVQFGLLNDFVFLDALSLRVHDVSFFLKAK
jgi:hypothetical protein